MSDTSYEQNIANRLRDRLDGTMLDKWAAHVIDGLLAENARLKAQLDESEKTNTAEPASKVISAKDLKSATAGCEHAVGRKTRWA